MTPSNPASPSAFGTMPDGPPPSVGQRLRRMLVAGLVVLAPVTLTAFVLYQLFELLDGLFEPLVVRVVGTRVPGVGLMLTLLLVLALGWLSTRVLGRRMIHLAERVVARVPIGRSVYSASKSVLEVLSERQTDAFKRVAMIEYPRRGLFSIVFVTSKVRWAGAHPDLSESQAVFLPTTPNPTSGYLLLVPQAELIELPITVEEGVRLVISGGILLPKSVDLNAPFDPSTGEPTAPPDVP